MKKKIVSVLMCTVLTASMLAGCGSGATNPPADASDATAGDTAAADTAAGDTAAGDVATEDAAEANCVGTMLILKKINPLKMQ